MKIKSLVCVLALIFTGCNSSQDIIVSSKNWHTDKSLHRLGSTVTTESPRFTYGDYKEISSRTEVVPSVGFDMEGNTTMTLDTETIYTVRPWEKIDTKSLDGTGDNVKYADISLPSPQSEYKITSSVTYTINGGELELLCTPEQYRGITEGDTISVTYRENKLIKFEKIRSETLENKDFDL